MTFKRLRTGNLMLLLLMSGLLAARAIGQENTATRSPVSASSPAPAQSPATAEPPDNDRIPFMTRDRGGIEAEAPSASGLLMRTIGALLLIIGLIAAAAWGLRRFGGAKFANSPEDAPELAVIATLSLGDRRSLAAVRFGDRLLLIGSTPQSITLLANSQRRSTQAAPRARSVADLLQEDRESKPSSFEESLETAMERHGEERRRDEVARR